MFWTKWNIQIGRALGVLIFRGDMDHSHKINTATKVLIT